MKLWKKMTALVLATVMVLSLFAGCQNTEDPQPSAKDTVIVLEAKTATTLNDKKLNETIPAAIAEMITGGALTPADNTVLISVNSTDAELRASVLELVGAAFGAEGFAGAALCQYAENPAEGKQALVDKLIAANDSYAADELKGLSVNVLALLTETNDLAEVETYGEFSQEALVGADIALAVGIANVEAEETDIADPSVALDINEGSLFYSVHFTYEGTAYETYVDAYTADTLYCGIVGGDRIDNLVDEMVSEETALAAACLSVGAEVAGIKNQKVEFVDFSLQPYYEISFDFNGTSHRVLISAITGNVMEGDVAPSEDPDNEDIDEATTPIEDDEEQTSDDEGADAGAVEG